MAGRLILVATPIGNLADLSPRAAEMLTTADVIAVEDTRRTGRLLAHIGSRVPQVSYHDHNERQRLAQLIARIEAGETVALVTDAGTPGISDPGYRLVRACAERGLDVTAIPGPAALVHALVVSGLPTDRFVFEGFLPRRGGARTSRLAELERDPRTLVFYVSPHRAADDLADLAATLGADRPAVLCRELTKLHEEVRRSTLGDLAAQVVEAGVRGEATLVVAGAPARDDAADGEDLVAEVERRVEAGTSRRDAISAVATERGVPRRALYQAVVDSTPS